jgi:hypothetical protein
MRIWGKRHPSEFLACNCPLCGKGIKAGNRIMLNYAFKHHLEHCSQYRALTAVSAILKGLRVPRFGNKLIEEGSRGLLVSSPYYNAAVDKFSQQFHLKDDGGIYHGKHGVVKVDLIPEILAMLGVRILL